MGLRALLPFLAAIAMAAGCVGGEGARGEREVGTSAVVEVGPPEPESALSPAEEAARIAAARDEDDGLAREDARSYAERRASMAGYAECIGQARGTPEHVRRRIEEACGRLPDAPR